MKALFGVATPCAGMAEDDRPDEEDQPSFRERLEDAREGEGTEQDDPFGGMGAGMGGNPFAQMMGGMMGGGPGAGMQQEARDGAVAREIAQLREDVSDLTEQVQRIADALEDDSSFD